MQKSISTIAEYLSIRNWISHLLSPHSISRLFLLFLSLFIFTSTLSAQNKEALQSQRKQLVQKIKLTESELARTQSSKKSSVTALKTLGIKIRSREKLISTYQAEITLTEKRIEETDDIILSLNEDIQKLKEEYAEMIRAAYKNKSSDNAMMFLFSSQDFNDMVRRIRYLQYYSDHRKRQYELIDKTKTDLENKIEELKRTKTDLRAMLSEQTSQISTLSSEKEQKDRLIKELEGSEASLVVSLKKQKDEAKKLTQEIEKIIREELRKATSAAGSVAEKKTSKNKTTASSVTYALTPEAQLISKNFSGNKGKLPWPVERGYVSGSFGEGAHELRKNIKTSNNGVDITTSSDASVRSVFEGKVLNIVFNPAFQKAIIVSHGDYFTVYANLKEVYVKKGENVDTKQVLGLAYTDAEDGETMVHLEVWKGTRQLNPALWIIRK